MERERAAEFIAALHRAEELLYRTFRMRRRELLVGEGGHFAAVTDGSAVIAGRTRAWSTIGLYRLRDERLAECWLIPFDQDQFDSIWGAWNDAGTAARTADAGHGPTGAGG